MFGKCFSWFGRFIVVLHIVQCDLCMLYYFLFVKLYCQEPLKEHSDITQVCSS
jgi:hypothetical protein